MQTHALALQRQEEIRQAVLRQREAEELAHCTQFHAQKPAGRQQGGSKASRRDQVQQAAREEQRLATEQATDAHDASVQGTSTPPSHAAHKAPSAVDRVGNQVQSTQKKHKPKPSRVSATAAIRRGGNPAALQRMVSASALHTRRQEDATQRRERIRIKQEEARAQRGAGWNPHNSSPKTTLSRSMSKT